MIEAGIETDARVANAIGIVTTKIWVMACLCDDPPPAYSTDRRLVGEMLEWVAKKQYPLGENASRVCVVPGYSSGWCVAHEKWNTINDFIIAEPVTLELACCAAVLAVAEVTP